MKKNQDMLRVRRDTKVAMRKIAKVKGWTLADAADRAVKALIEREDDLQSPSTPSTPSHAQHSPAA